MQGIQSTLTNDTVTWATTDQDTRLFFIFSFFVNNATVTCPILKQILAGWEL